MRIEPLPVFAGGVVLWLIIAATRIVGKRVADARALDTVLADGNPVAKVRAGAAREVLRFLLCIIIAALFAIAPQVQGIHTIGRAVATDQLMIMVPVVFVVGLGVGAKSPMSAIIRAAGLFVGATVATLVIFALG